MADLVSLSVAHVPNKTRYVSGDFFEKYGMTIRAHYSEGSPGNPNTHMMPLAGLFPAHPTETRKHTPMSTAQLWEGHWEGCPRLAA